MMTRVKPSFDFSTMTWFFGYRAEQRIK